MSSRSVGSCSVRGVAAETKADPFAHRNTVMQQHNTAMRTNLNRLNTTLALTSPASWGHDYGKAESWESEQTSEYLEPTSRGWAYRGTPAWNEQQTQRKEAAKARGEEIDSKPAQTQQQRKNCRVKDLLTAPSVSSPTSQNNSTYVWDDALKQDLRSVDRHFFIKSSGIF